MACGFSLSSCGMWAPENGGSAVCGSRALLLRCTGSVAVACGLSCPPACEILVPRSGIEPTSPALEGGFLTTGPPAKSRILPSLKREKKKPQGKGLLLCCFSNHDSLTLSNLTEHHSTLSSFYELLNNIDIKHKMQAFSEQTESPCQHFIKLF